jgi:WD40 repeat protein
MSDLHSPPRLLNGSGGMSLTGVAFSPDGKTLEVGGMHAQVFLWDFRRPNPALSGWGHDTHIYV